MCEKGTRAVGHTLAKITVERSAERRRRDPRLRKVKQVRRDTNYEILHRGFIKNGRVTLNVPVRIWDVNAKVYAGWHGAAITVYCPDVTTAEKFEQDHRAFILQYARDNNLGTSYGADEAKES